jgi:glycosyltransferase involved in cell wall biosynthesis
MTKLSVIVPCYNCAETLADAVASIYSQDVGIPFDVTMVDDGSTDTTYDVMKQLAAQHSNIRLVQHASNQGGGAARNTAVANSTGDLIFCLDADDLLGAGFLRAITEFWLRRRCDGVGMSTSIKFRGTDIQNVAYVSAFGGPGQRVRFESFLGKEPCSLTVVFLLTRRAFGITGGYPTTHGFDTQGMGFRFLCNGLTAYTCPDTVYYHRVEFQESYYLREQRDGRLNWNWFHVLDEFLYVFSRDTQSKILESDLFPLPGRPVPPSLLELVQGRDKIYAPNYRRLVRLGRHGVARRLAKSGSKFDQYWLGGYRASMGDYGRALQSFERALSLGFGYKMIHYKMLEASLRLAENPAPAIRALNELALYCQPFPIQRRPLSHRLMYYGLRSRLLRWPLGWLNSRWLRLRRSIGGRGT